MYSPAIERALQASLAAHAGQTRKGAAVVPYIVHPLHVALMLARWGVEDDVIVAGLLHDAVEDNAALWPLARIEAEFGSHVAHVVGELTEDKSKSWEERKRWQVERVPHLSPQAATVKAADKLHNLQSLAAELRATTDPAAVWARFRGGRERTLAMSAELVDVLAHRVDPKVARALRVALEAVRTADAATLQLAVPRAAPTPS